MVSETASTMSMTTPLLPDWLRIVWIGVLCVVFIVHVWHALSMSGVLRWWHVSHIVMALGMIAMYLSHGVLSDLSWVGVGLFGALTVGMASATVVLWRRDRLLNRLWAASTVDMIAMAYMSLPTADQPVLVTYLFVAYLCAEILVWLVGPLRRSRLRSQAAGGVQVRLSQPATSGARSAKSPWPEADRRSAPNPEASASGKPAPLFADVTVGVRLTLAVMTASMVHMFIAMQTMQAHTMPVMGPMMPMH